MKAAISAWVADECNRVLGRKLSEGGEVLHADLVRDARVKELDAWGSSKVLKLLKAGNARNTAVDTRWVLRWKTVDGVKTARVRLAAEGFQDSDLQDGIADTPGCVSLLSSHLLGALK